MKEAKKEDGEEDGELYKGQHQEIEIIPNITINQSNHHLHFVKNN